MPLFSSILLLAGLAVAVPVANGVEECYSRTICVDAINTCGIRYGGCYDVCDLSAKPVAPPCLTTTKKPPIPTTTQVITKVTTLNPKPTTTKKTTRKPAPTTTKKPTKKPTPTPTKKPTPTLTKKPTPKPTKKTTTKKPHPTTTKPTVKPPVTPTPTKKFTTSTTKAVSCNTHVSVCWDGINECGMMYGGCFPDCKPWPTFTPPPCPTKSAPVVTTKVVTLQPPLTVPHN